VTGVNPNGATQGRATTAIVGPQLAEAIISHRLSFRAWPAQWPLAPPRGDVGIQYFSTGFPLSTSPR